MMIALSFILYVTLQPFSATNSTDHPGDLFGKQYKPQLVELIIDPNTVACLNTNMVMDCNACVICKKAIDVCDSNINSEHTVCYVILFYF